mmetsp:Transcript_86095/g.229767  ORF Transcript_86095/g.229767 Transcript_86095/m.229767 type:complete len:612 (+) Transcript_86095:128-1963(+)
MEYEYCAGNVWTQGISSVSSQNEEYYRQNPIQPQTTPASELSALTSDGWNAGSATRFLHSHVGFPSIGRSTAFETSNTSIHPSSEELTDRSVQRYPNTIQSLSWPLAAGNGNTTNGSGRRPHNTCGNSETWSTGQGSDQTLPNPGNWKNSVNEFGMTDSTSLSSNWSLSMTPRSETSGEGREGSTSREVVHAFELQAEGISQSRHVNDGLNQGTWQQKGPTSQHASRTQQSVHAIASVRDGSNHPSRYQQFADEALQSHKHLRFVSPSSLHPGNSSPLFVSDELPSKAPDPSLKSQNLTPIAVLKDSVQPGRPQKRTRGSSKVAESSFSPSQNSVPIGLVDRAKKKTQRIVDDSQGPAQEIARSRDPRGQSANDLKPLKDGEIPGTPSSCSVSLGASTGKCTVTVTGDSTSRRLRTRELLARLQGVLSSFGGTNTNQPDTSSSLGSTPAQQNDDKAAAWSMNEILAKAVSRISQLPGRGDRTNEKDTLGGNRSKSWCNGCGECRECEAALVERRCSKSPRFPPSFPDDPSLFAPYSNGGEENFIQAARDDCASGQVAEPDDLGAYVADLVPCLSMTLKPVPVSGERDHANNGECVTYQVGYVATSCRSIIG